MATTQSTHAARVIDGKAIAAGVTARVRDETERLLKETGVQPGLAVVLVGTDPASEVYVRNKGRTAKEVGFHSVQHTLDPATSEADLLALVGKLNADPAIHGILVQMPLPKQIRSTAVIEAILPEKDVDGLSPVNAGRLSGGMVDRALVPCTPAGSMVLLRHALGNDLAGREAVVIGRSVLVGKPVAQLLLNENCTVTMAHSRTRDLPSVVRRAEIVVAAVGKPEMVRGDWVREGAAVIDVGINRAPAPDKGAGATRLVGDVAYAEAAQRAAWITPVPGGVGPMTIAMLMANTLIAACRSVGKPEPKF
jgi:methylenetetrahydrofolate dehydrogenase (NADP+)/methenyltetrahydrofolate cyclohydrolase